MKTALGFITPADIEGNEPHERRGECSRFVFYNGFSGIECFYGAGEFVFNFHEDEPVIKTGNLEKLTEPLQIAIIDAMKLVAEKLKGIVEFHWQSSNFTGYDKSYVHLVTRVTLFEKVEDLDTKVYPLMRILRNAIDEEAKKLNLIKS